MTRQKGELLSDATNAIRGVLIGGADVVPGVSGGTVALVLGIYERLLQAISRFDLTFIGQLRAGKWREAAEHIDLRFLTSLGCGVAAGFLATVLVINGLLSSPIARPLTLAAFFGVILASGLLVAGRIRCRAWGQWLLCGLLGATGAAGALWLVVQQGHVVEPSYPFLFFCGALAICAMILPGISGAMILLLLGVYEYLTGIPRAILNGEQIANGMFSILVFAAGCATGLLSFSKLLRWLLDRHHQATLAVMCGFMFGALPRLWPFQNAEAFEEKRFEPIWPAALDGHVLAVLGVALIAVVLVLAGHRLARTFPAGSLSATLTGKRAIGS